MTMAVSWFGLLIPVIVFVVALVVGCGAQANLTRVRKEHCKQFGAEWRHNTGKLKTDAIARENLVSVNDSELTPTTKAWRGEQRQ